jgi:hypothetical protein
MASFICDGILDFLTEDQKSKLNKKFRSSELKVMPHELAGPLALKYSEALAILTILQAEGLCKNLLLIYHNCEPDTPIDAIPFEEGIPKVPFECKSCQELIQDLSELSFDVMAILFSSIEFI